MSLCYEQSKCLNCKSDLKILRKSSNIVTVYSATGSKEYIHLLKVCSHQACRSHYHFTHFTKKNVFYKEKNLAKFFYEDSTRKNIFLSSNYTGFESSYLRSMMTDMMLCPEYSFCQKATAYNLSVPTGNLELNQKRLLEGFMLFALLEMLTMYIPNSKLSSTAFSFDLDENLNTWTTALKDGFQGHHATHRCNTPGCGSVIGWDADCKVFLNDFLS